ncbi:HEAT repeat domain-containing protein [Candidatus Desantisbacteria bacterium]|nr:HEAT repeat domain-containing protein [Candidatus Desantisbacteria bacterium]
MYKKNYIFLLILILTSCSSLNRTSVYEKNSIDKLSMELANNNDISARISIINALGSFNNKHAAKILITVFENKNENKIIHRAAALSLENMSNEEIIDPMISAFKTDSDKFVRRSAVRILGKIDNKKCIAPLLTALSDEDEMIRTIAINSLLKKKIKDVSPLLNMLEKSNANARISVIRLIGQLKINNAVKPLFNIINSTYSREELKEIYIALGNIGNKEAVEILLKQIKNVKNNDIHIRNLIIEILGKTKNKDAVPVLISLLENKDTAYYAISALGEIGDERAVIPLIKSLNIFDSGKFIEEILKKFNSIPVEAIINLYSEEKNNNIKVLIIEILSEIRNKQTLDLFMLITAFGDNNKNVRKAVTIALAKSNNKQVVSLLISAIKDADGETQEAIIDGLTAIGEPSIPPLMEELKNKKSVVRKVAAIVLANLNVKFNNDEERVWFFISDSRYYKAVKFGKIAVDPLIFAYINYEPYYMNDKNEIIKTLNKINDENISERLVALLKDGNKKNREAAINIIREINNDLAIDPLITLLEDCELSAIKRLGEIRDKRAVNPLIKLIKNDSTDIKIASIQALGEIGDTQAVEPLIDVFKNDLNKYVLMTVRAALSKLKKNDEPVLNYFTPFTQNKDKDLRVYAARSLGNAGDKDAADILINMLKDKEISVRDSAAEALGKIGDKRAVEPLITLLKNDTTNIILTSIQALEKLNDKRAINPIVEVLKDTNKDKKIKEYAGKALKNISDETAVDQLIDLLKFNSYRINVYAAEALANIGNTKAVTPILEHVNPNHLIGKYNKFDSSISNHLIAFQLTDEISVLRWQAAFYLDTYFEWIPEDDIEKAKFLIAYQKWDEVITLGSVAMQPLIDIIKKESYDYNYEKAGETLFKIDDKKGTDLVMNIIKDKNIEKNIKTKFFGILRKKYESAGADKDVLSVLISSLKGEYGEIYPKYAVKYITEILDKSNYKPANDEEKIWLLIANDEWGKVEQSGKISVTPLITLIEKKHLPGDVVEQAITASGNIGDATFVDVLIFALKNDNKSICIKSINALGNINDERAIIPLTDLFKDKDANVREKAKEILKNFK